MILKPKKGEESLSNYHQHRLNCKIFLLIGKNDSIINSFHILMVSYTMLYTQKGQSLCFENFCSCSLKSTRRQTFTTKDLHAVGSE